MKESSGNYWWMRKRVEKRLKMYAMCAVYSCIQSHLFIIYRDDVLPDLFLRSKFDILMIKEQKTRTYRNITFLMILSKFRSPPEDLSSGTEDFEKKILFSHLAF